MPLVNEATFHFRLTVPRWIGVEGRRMDRDEFFSWLWHRFGDQGLLGIHEGTLLSEEAAHEGLETDSWTVDSGEAPRERDWVAGRANEAELYFRSRSEADEAWTILRSEIRLVAGNVAEQPPEDWDAQWKASFLSSPNGIEIAPFWQVVPPWVEIHAHGKKILRINPGAGFGTGTHETTQLCLEALGTHFLGRSSRAPGGASGSSPSVPPRALDFGSGSGILSVAMALLGTEVEAVEIDPLAIDNARENSKLNQVEGKIRFSMELGAREQKYGWITANILRPVLLEFSEELVHRLSAGGVLILSGLIESDVGEVVQRYGGLLRSEPDCILTRNEWRALVWSKL